MPLRAVPWEAAGGGVAATVSGAAPKWATAPISGVAALDTTAAGATAVFGVSSEGQLALWTVPADPADSEAAGEAACPAEPMLPSHVAELPPMAIALSCEVAPAPRASGSAGMLLCFSGGVDGALRIWAPVAGGRLACLSSVIGSTDWVRGVRASGGAAGSELVVATASNDGRLRLWSLEAGAASGRGAAAVEKVTGADEEEEEPSLALGQVNRKQLITLPGPGTDDAAADAAAGSGAAGCGAAASPGATGSSGSLAIGCVAVLAGHEAAVASVAWLPTPVVPVEGSTAEVAAWEREAAAAAAAPSSAAGTPGAEAGTRGSAADGSMLVTAGEDSSLLLWQRVDGEWGPVVRLAASTGRQLPLLAAGVSRCGRVTWAAGVRGTSLAFTLDGPAGSLTAAREEDWVEASSLGGHVGRVAAAVWSPGAGDAATAQAVAGGTSASAEAITAAGSQRAIALTHLVTAGADHTTRVHAAVAADATLDRARRALGLPPLPATLDPASPGHAPAPLRWVEAARPQVHGHSLSCLAAACPAAAPETDSAPAATKTATAAASVGRSLPPSAPADCLAEHRLFSGGEEKVVRVFDAPCRFLETRDGICGTAGDADAAARWQRAAMHVGERAFRPELGLSNKSAGHGSASAAVAGTLDASEAVDEAGAAGSAGAGGVVDAPNRPDGHAPAGLVTVANTAAERLKLEQVIKDAARADAAAVHDGTAAPAPATVATIAPPSAPAGSRPPTTVPLPGGGGATSWAPSVKDLFGAQLGTQEGLAAAPGGSPLDGDLAGETLWPEMNKLYGHGDALVALAAHPSGNLLASSSLARTTEQARIRLWSTADGSPVAVLEAHESTAIGLAFSPCGSLLASVSRDRHLCLFRRLRPDEAAAAPAPWQLLARVKAHRRMAWCVAFAPAVDPTETLLVTGGKEGAVVAWRLSGDPAAADTSALRLARDKPVVEKTGSAVTALAFAPAMGASAPPVLAVGLDTGRVALFARRSGEEAWAPLGALPLSATHRGAVRSLAWTLAGAAPGQARLATAGDDGSSRVCVVDVRAALVRAGMGVSEQTVC